MKNSFKLFVLLVMIAGFFQPVFSQQRTSESVRNVLGKIQTMEIMYPQQKVYLHLDKEEYIAGESIWVKAYLVDAVRHLPDTMRANLYIEVVNSQHQPVNMVLLHSDFGFSNGQIELHDSLPEGSYLVRGYTNWMNNFDQELFFEKQIFVHNPSEVNYVRRGTVRQNRRFNRQVERKMEQMEFHLFPEGGNLVEGLENRVAFKASNALGSGMAASGEILGSNGGLVAQFQTERDGMGTFSFTPQAGVAYRAVVHFENGRRMNVDLPMAMTQGYVLKADLVNQEIQIQVDANFDPAAYGIAPEIFLLGQTRSHAYFLETGTLNNGSFQTRVLADVLPTGVCQITLFDANGTPLAERLVFVNHQDMLPVEISTRELTIDNFQGLEVDVNVEGVFSEGSYSLSIIHSDAEISPAESHIGSYLLLTSDLENSIQAPASYFSEQTPEMNQVMDLLMLTNGWRRFKWDRILAGEFPQITYGRASGLTIAGTVTPTSSAFPTGEIAVQMVVNQEGRKVHSTTTDNQGSFAFPGIYYNEYFLAEFSIPMDPAGRNLRIELLSRDFQELVFTRDFNTRPTSIVSRGSRWRKVSRPETTLSPRKRLEANEQPIYGNADQVIHMQDLQSHYTNVYEVLQARATGLMVSNGRIMLRGPSSINLSNEPMFMIDGIMTHSSVFFNMPVTDVDRLEIIKGSSAAIYGVRGANGVILAYTRRGMHETPRTVDYLLIGFQSPREFSASNLPLNLYQQTEVAKTIFWEPSVSLNQNGNANWTLQLTNPNQNIRILFEGIDQNGKLAFKEYHIKR